MRLFGYFGGAGAACLAVVDAVLAGKAAARGATGTALFVGVCGAACLYFAGSMILGQRKHNKWMDDFTARFGAE